jgi:hypothetical protein
MTYAKADAVDRAELFGFERWLAREQFCQRRGGALARIFLDELFNEQERFCFATCRNVTPGLDPGVHRF